MVLTLKRAVAVALAVAIHATGLAAQQGSAPILKPTGEIRPLLYGFALGCASCPPGERGRGRSGGGGGPPVVSYRSYPEVLAVAPGSAAEQAGIAEGDILQSIDGMSVLTDAGARRLALATAGETVRLGFQRDSKSIVVSLALGESARGRGNGPKRIYGGYVAMQGRLNGDVRMEIWSDEPMYPQEAADSNSMVLRIGTGTIIKVQLKKDSTDSGGGRSGRGRTGGKP